MKKFSKLGKSLSKAEQKQILGGDFGDSGLPDVGPNGPCQVFGIGTPQCQCYYEGGTWNAECNRCDTEAYFADGCDQIPLDGGFPLGLGGGN
ncbi:MAG: hypothetical protein AAFR87_19070 [Bacteroidota bacterium]